MHKGMLLFGLSVCPRRWPLLLWSSSDRILLSVAAALSLWSIQPGTNMIQNYCWIFYVLQITQQLNCPVSERHHCQAVAMETAQLKMLKMTISFSTWRRMTHSYLMTRMTSQRHRWRHCASQARRWRQHHETTRRYAATTKHCHLSCHVLITSRGSNCIWLTPEMTSLNTGSEICRV